MLNLNLHNIPVRKAIPYWVSGYLVSAQLMSGGPWEELMYQSSASGLVLRECADQLGHVLTDLFNTSLNHAVVPSCFKNFTIMLVPKNSPVPCLNDYHLLGLTMCISVPHSTQSSSSMKECGKRRQLMGTGVPQTALSFIHSFSSITLWWTAALCF